LHVCAVLPCLPYYRLPPEPERGWFKTIDLSQHKLHLIGLVGEQRVFWGYK